jgi:ArsR family transcriptional regulator
MTNLADFYTSYADRFKLLGHPVRLQILDALRRDPECVCHLEAALGRPQPYISQQLRVLREAGVVADRKDGLNVYYHLIDSQAMTLLNVALGPVLPETRSRQERPLDCTCPRCMPPLVAEITLVES